MLDTRVFEDGAVEIGGFLGLRVEPQEGLDFLFLERHFLRVLDEGKAGMETRGCTRFIGG